jgi:6-phosphofructokinase 1
VTSLVAQRPEVDTLRVGILTSGGDAPGMNAVLFGACDELSRSGGRLLGFAHGFQGLLEQPPTEITLHDVHDLPRQAGTMLGTSRWAGIRTPEGLEGCVRAVTKARLDGLVVVGGNGSLEAARRLAEHDIQVAFVPATIDNDVDETDLTIGFDSAVAYAVDVVERLRVTGGALPGRAFVVEVLGGSSGNLARAVARAAGVDLVIVPEEAPPLADVAAALARRADRGEAIAILSEGAGDAVRIGEALEEQAGIRVRATILGHAQRAADPTSRDVLLGRRAGRLAIERLRAHSSALIRIASTGDLRPLPLRRCRGAC